MNRPLAVLVGLLLGCASCATAPPPVPPATGPARPEPVAKAELPPPQPESAPPAPAYDAVYFGFDSASLDEPSRRSLDRCAEALRAGRVALTIEGHADDRGTEEYNLALGEQRASAVLKYLRQSGVEDARLRSVSYGEERPAVSGQDDSAWAKNRRAELAPR